ncbi:class I histocompatibility antigen, B alpha chain-like [Colossoma macropomum]|uniref:class I histocompatibility antigen, B alpha chain-like n=1 Tax=Colossoma macropomum TaxID=42526 RepID=UPI00186564BB|nr:class I histocompatibility antigen, B alpha chain-like [Colossoma macropomum]
MDSRRPKLVINCGASPIRSPTKTPGPAKESPGRELQPIPKRPISVDSKSVFPTPNLDLNTETWTAVNTKAVITKRRWESQDEAAFVKAYLQNECTAWLQKYVGYSRSSLERKVPPEVSLFQKDSSSPVVCHATGFFPKAVMISWQKNGEDLHEDVELRETLPNQDGTFQKRSVLTVSPEELNKHDYTCIIQHSSLEEKMVLHVIHHRGERNKHYSIF